MPYKLIIELSDRDLRQFRSELRKSRASVSIADDAEILSAAADLIAAMQSARLPDFVTWRLKKLEMMLAMVSDSEWTIANRERSPVLAALAYLCDPEDIIHDDVPGVGLLDDAVMIELVALELRHEIEAYADFECYRAAMPKPADGQDRNVTSKRRLEKRRKQLVARMRRRKAADQARGRTP
jgi:uncharacterized membrane protein YkvA (DUF1232 family)